MQVLVAARGDPVYNTLPSSLPAPPPTHFLSANPAFRAPGGDVQSPTGSSSWEQSGWACSWPQGQEGWPWCPLCGNLSAAGCMGSTEEAWHGMPMQWTIGRAHLSLALNSDTSGGERPEDTAAAHGFQVPLPGHPSWAPEG